MTGLVRRFRSLPVARPRLLRFELVLVAVLLSLTVLVPRIGGVWDAVALAALGYAVGLTAHVVLVLLGWERSRAEAGAAAKPALVGRRGRRAVPY